MEGVHTGRGGPPSVGGGWGVAGLPARCVTLLGQCATIFMMLDHIFTVWH